MKVLEQEKVDLDAVIKHAKKEPVLLLTPDGREFMVSDADDFERGRAAAEQCRFPEVSGCALCQSWKNSIGDGSEKDRTGFRQGEARGESEAEERAELSEACEMR